MTAYLDMLERSQACLSHESTLASVHTQFSNGKRVFYVPNSTDDPEGSGRMSKPLGDDASAAFACAMRSLFIGDTQARQKAIDLLGPWTQTTISSADDSQIAMAHTGVGLLLAADMLNAPAATERGSPRSRRGPRTSTTRRCLASTRSTATTIARGRSSRSSYTPTWSTMTRCSGRAPRTCTRTSMPPSMPMASSRRRFLARDTGCSTRTSRSRRSRRRCNHLQRHRQQHSAADCNGASAPPRYPELRLLQRPSRGVAGPAAIEP